MNHNANASMIKRVMAAALVLAMMLTTLGGYAPGWLSAFAEDGAALESAAPQEQNTSEAQEPSETGASDEGTSDAGISDAGTSDEATSSASQSSAPSPEGKTEEGASAQEGVSAQVNASAAQQPSPAGEGGSASALTEGVHEANASTQSDASAQDQTTSEAQEPSPLGKVAQPQAETDEVATDAGSAQDTTASVESQNGNDGTGMNGETSDEGTSSASQGSAPSPKGKAGEDASAQEDAPAAQEPSPDGEGGSASALTEEVLMVDVSAQADAPAAQADTPVEQAATPTTEQLPAGEQDGAAMPEAAGEAPMPQAVAQIRAFAMPVTPESALAGYEASTSEAAAGAQASGVDPIVPASNAAQEEPANANAGGDSKGGESDEDKSGDKISALQQMIKEKLAAQTVLSGIVRIVLAKEEHDKVINPNSNSILDKAEDVLNWVEHSFDQNMVKKAIINVKEKARLYATHDIDLTAQVEQAGGLFQNDLIGMIADPVNVKVGTAQVNVASSAVLAAGYGTDGTEDPSGSGSIDIKAKLSANVTAGQGAVAMPIAVNVAVENATVNVEKDAVLKAAGNIALNAESKIEAAAKSSNKIASKQLPFAAAVGVILNSATVDVQGKLTAGKSVAAVARGDLTTDASAKHDAVYQFSAPMTMYRALDVAEIPLPAGTYYLEYEIEDVFMRKTTLDRIEIHWDGENMTFPEDFCWEDGEWIDLASLRNK